MRKVEKSVIEIKEDVRIGDVILEVGDKIKVLEAMNAREVEAAINSNYVDAFNFKTDGDIVSWEMNGDDLDFDDGKRYYFSLDLNNMDISYSDDGGYGGNYDGEVSLNQLKDMAEFMTDSDWV